MALASRKLRSHLPLVTSIPRERQSMEKRLSSKIFKRGTITSPRSPALQRVWTQDGRFRGQNDRETNVSHSFNHLNKRKDIDNIMSIALASVPAEAKGLFAHPLATSGPHM